MRLNECSLEFLEWTQRAASGTAESLARDEIDIGAVTSQFASQRPLALATSVEDEVDMYISVYNGQFPYSTPLHI